MSEISLLMVGDLVLDEPDADFFFDHVRTQLQAADLVVGHIETPYTSRGKELQFDNPAEATDPAKIAALARAGFDAGSVAGNHVYDFGNEGVEDTVAALHANGIAPFGAGANLDAARKPAILERQGKKFGFLSYNCVGPKETWASANKGGCAYLNVLSHYEHEGANPGGPPLAYTFATPDSIEAMQDDIERLRSQVDVVTVAMHKGLVHTPVKLAMYERPVAKAAIDAGADIVIGHHPHIGRGIEVYKGKPIFHGLGNFVTVTQALNVEANAHPKRLAWAKRRRELFGFSPDPDYKCYPFHPDSKNTMIADCRIQADGRVSAGFRPCWIMPSGQPEILGNDARGQAVVDYFIRITQEAGLKANFAWEGDRVVVD